MQYNCACLFETFHAFSLPRAAMSLDIDLELWCFLIVILLVVCSEYQLLHLTPTKTSSLQWPNDVFNGEVYQDYQTFVMLFYSHIFLFFALS